VSDLVNRLCGIANEERHNQHVNGISFVCDQAADRIAELEAQNTFWACAKHSINNTLRCAICDEARIAELESKHDTSELLHEIDELNRHNKVLQKADMHREKIWKNRIAELEAEKVNLEQRYHSHKVSDSDTLREQRSGKRKMHLNGVECVHGKFLHESCGACEEAPSI